MKPIINSAFVNLMTTWSSGTSAMSTRGPISSRTTSSLHVTPCCWVGNLRRRHGTRRHHYPGEPLRVVRGDRVTYLLYEVDGTTKGGV
jgi:hypothetical protein